MGAIQLLNSTATFLVLTVTIATFLVQFIIGRVRDKQQWVEKRDIPEPIRRRFRFNVGLYLDVSMYVVALSVDVFFLVRYARLLMALTWVAEGATQSTPDFFDMYRVSLGAIAWAVPILFVLILVLQFNEQWLLRRIQRPEEQGYMATLQRKPTGLVRVDALLERAEQLLGTREYTASLLATFSALELLFQSYVQQDRQVPFAILMRGLRPLLPKDLMNELNGLRLIRNSVAHPNAEAQPPIAADAQAAIALAWRVVNFLRSRGEAA